MRRRTIGRGIRVERYRQGGLDSRNFAQRACLAQSYSNMLPVRSIGIRGSLLILHLDWQSGWASDSVRRVQCNGEYHEESKRTAMSRMPTSAPSRNAESECVDSNAAFNAVQQL